MLPARRILLVALLAAGYGLACARLPDSVIVVDQAELWLGTSPDFPVAAHFEPVKLRDRWLLERRRSGAEGWYRASFEAGPEPETGRPAQAIRLETLYPNGEVFLNGVALGSGGRLEPPPARNRFRAVYLGFPGNLLRQGDNEIWIRFVGTAGSIGVVSPIQVGPARDLWPIQQWSTFVGVDAVRLGFALAFLLAGILAVGSLASEAPAGTPAGNIWFAAGLSSLVVSGMTAFTADLAIPSRVVEWTALCATHWTVLAFAVGVSRSLGDSRGGVRAWMAIYAALSGVGLLIPSLYHPALWFVWWLPSGLLCLIMLFRMGRRVVVQGEMRWGLGLMLVLVALISPAIGARFPVSRVSAAMVPLGFVLVVGTHLFLQLRDAQRNAEQLNRELEGRVAAREAELAANYARLGELERERSIVEERQRITRDMHDGVGGHLVSALSQVRGSHTDSGTLERTLEEALFDLRLTIDSFQPGASDLPALLGGMRASLARRVELSDMQLHWRISDAGEDHPLPPDALLHVIRFVQEAVTNAVQHSGGRTVAVATEEVEAGVALCVEDDGSGGVAERDGGSGLRHMRERAALLGSPLRVSSTKAGTKITLQIPLTPLERRPAEPSPPQNWGA